MANGTIILSKAVWKGDIEIAEVRVFEVFKVFDSGGRWKSLFGKLMLHGFKAIHNYEKDQVDISGVSETHTLHNQNLAMKPSIEKAAKEVHNLRMEEPPPQQWEVGSTKVGYLAGCSVVRCVGGWR